MKVFFTTLAHRYTMDKLLVEQLWNQIHLAYTSENRFYHTLNHLRKIFSTITPYEHKLNEKDAVLFAAWYHDIVYDPRQNNNEEQSAVVADNSLKALHVPVNIIEKTMKIILMTRTHTTDESTGFDGDLFLDADLAILGSPAEEYFQYKEAVRKEFSHYPAPIYNMGRKKVLQHFLDSESIYKTTELYSELEAQARNNISLELKLLSL